MSNAHISTSSLLICATILGTGLFLQSCGSKKLDRDKAVEIISTTYNYPNVVFRELQIYGSTDARRGRNIVSIGGFMKERWVDISDLISKELVSVDRGQMVVRTNRLTTKVPQYGPAYRYTLTDRARIYLKPGTDITRVPSKDLEQFEVKICNARIKEVTGIRMNGEGTSAEVDYTIELYDFTPFLLLEGQEWPHEQNLKIKLSLFDDGWRVDPNEPKPEEPYMSVSEFEAHSNGVQAKIGGTNSAQSSSDANGDSDEDDYVLEGDSDFPAGSAHAEPDVCAVYYGERKGGQECIRIERDRTFKHFWRCSDPSPAGSGTWGLRTYQGKQIIGLEGSGDELKDCWQHHDDCRLELGRNESGKRFVIWNNRIYTER